MAKRTTKKDSGTLGGAKGGGGGSGGTKGNSRPGPPTTGARGGPKSK